MTKKLQAVLEKMPQVGFAFDEANHIYALDGKPLTGVTTILQVISKPALIQWAANMACDHLENQFKNIVFPSKDGDGIEHMDISYQGLFDLVKEARIAHRKKKEGAADVGTKAHDWIERYVKA